MGKAWLLGAIGYPCLELLWRKRTHPAMALAGAAACEALFRCARGRGGLVRRALRGALCITAIEYAAGLIFNRRHHIWDYRGEWGHVQGQICPRFFFLWALLSGALMGGAKAAALIPRPKRRARRRAARGA